MRASPHWPRALPASAAHLAAQAFRLARNQQLQCRTGLSDHRRRTAAGGERVPGGRHQRATSELARAHGAVPLLVVLQFGHEEPAEQALRRRIVDDTGLPYILVEIDSAWRLSWDRHPNARAAHAIAVAIATELRRQLCVAPSIK